VPENSKATWMGRNGAQGRDPGINRKEERGGGGGMEDEEGLGSEEPAKEELGWYGGRGGVSRDRAMDDPEREVGPAGPRRFGMARREGHARRLGTWSGSALASR
jgi:hypothetical protein